MKRILLVALAFSFFVTPISAQQSSDNFRAEKTTSEKGSLTGKITDAKTGEILPGATIYIQELKTGAVANNNGMYKTPSIINGRYTIEVTYQGYASTVETVTVNGVTAKDFQLNQTYVEQQSVTVTSVASAISTKRSAQPVSVLKHDELNQLVSTNIIDALSKSIPGVSSVSTGPAIAKPVIRGLGYNRVVVVNDGIRQEGQQWGDEHGIEVDEASVQRAEIVKGPASIIYGSDALAGVIHFITNVPVAEGTIKGNVLTGY